MENSTTHPASRWPALRVGWHWPLPVKKELPRSTKLLSKGHQTTNHGFTKQTYQASGSTEQRRLLGLCYACAMLSSRLRLQSHRTKPEPLHGRSRTLQIQTHTCKCMYTCIRVCIYIYMSIRMYTCVYTYVYTHTHIYIYILYTHIRCI